MLLAVVTSLATADFCTVTERSSSLRGEVFVPAGDVAALSPQSYLLTGLGSVSLDIVRLGRAISPQC